MLYKFTVCYEIPMKFVSDISFAVVSVVAFDSIVLSKKKLKKKFFNYINERHKNVFLNKKIQKIIENRKIIAFITCSMFHKNTINFT